MLHPSITYNITELDKSTILIIEVLIWPTIFYILLRYFHRRTFRVEMLLIRKVKKTRVVSVILMRLITEYLVQDSYNFDNRQHMAIVLDCGVKTVNLSGGSRLYVESVC